MIDRIEINDVAKETICVLNYFSPNFISKIPMKGIEDLKELAKNSTLNVEIDTTKKLKEQNISEECKSLISLIYYKYIATEEEKKEILKIWNENELIYQKNLSEKYNINNVFSEKNAKITSQTSSELPTIIQKKSIIRRIIEFLKKRSKHKI